MLLKLENQAEKNIKTKRKLVKGSGFDSSLVSRIWKNGIETGKYYVMGGYIGILNPKP